MSSRIARGRRHRCPAIAAGSLAIAFGLYAASPFVTLWSVASALQHDDPGAVRTALDWRTVRTGLKAELGGGPAVTLASASAAAAQDDLPGFGESFATTIVSHVVDDVVTPEHLVTMLSQAGTAPASRAASPGSVLGRVRHVGFDGPTGFEAAFRLGDDPEAAPVTISMRIEKWQWKITRIHLPDQMLNPGSNRT